MTVRGVWVIRPPATGYEKGKVLFSRRYPTVERRAKGVSPSLYHPLPHDSELTSAVVLKCSKSQTPPRLGEFVEERDSCSLPFQKPVYELLAGKLWPVVCIEKNDLLFVAVTLVESRGEERPPLIEIPSIPAAIALLEGMAEVLGPNTEDMNETSPRLMELYQYLCLAAPFGSPMDTNPSNLKCHLKQKKTAVMPKQKQPAWKAGVYKGTSKLYLTVKEEIRAVQYDKQEVANTWEVFGTVQCKAELEGHPDVLVTLTTPLGVPPLDHLVVHPCVQTADVSPISPDDSSAQTIRKLRFSAPSEAITLCHYQASGVPSLPMRGFYQMKGDKTVKVLVQLKLNETVRNSFEYCEVRMPLFHRGPIEKVDNVVPLSATSALSLSQDRRTVIWNVGQKFPSKTLEVSLQATVHFPEHSDASEEVEEDPFCIELNAYADLFFRISDFTLSGCTIDPKSITLFPSGKYRPFLGRELCSSNYRIWNSHGNIIAAFTQSKSL